MDRNLALEVVRVTEAAALLASRYMGRGDEKLAVDSAIDAMEKAFLSVAVKGKVVNGGISNRSKDKTDDIIVGNIDGTEVDVVIDPLDGKKTCARGGQNAISAVALGEPGAFFNAPPVYMEKIAVGEAAKGIIDIAQPPEINIKRLARIFNIITMYPLKNVFLFGASISF